MSRTILREIKVTTEPAAEPVLKATLKNYLKLGSDTTDDTLIESLIKSARIEAERWCNRAFLDQTIKIWCSAFGDKVELPRAPIQSITSVKTKYLNTLTTLTENTDFYVHGYDEKYLLMATPFRLPVGHSPYDNIDDYGLEVIYVAGYGSAATSVPEPIIIAIQKIAMFNYLNRQNENMIIPVEAKKLLSTYKIYQ